MGFENVGQIEKNKQSGKSLLMRVEKPVAAGEMLYVDLESIEEVIAGTKDYASVARRTENTE